MPEQDQIITYRDFALRLVEEAGGVISRRLDQGFTARKKIDSSFVTDIDLEVEQLVRDRITARFPDHGVIGEEYGTLNPESPFQWVVDPVDGTLSLRHGIPLYGTILALMHGENALLGIISLPGLGHCFHGASGLGAFRDDERISIREMPPDDEIEDEIIATGDRKQFVTSGRLPAFELLLHRHPRVRTYTDCFGHALAATGAVGAMVDFDLNVWDAAATRIIIEEAGGMYVRLPSEEDRVAKHDLVFGKPRVVRWILDQLSQVGYG